MGTELRLNVQGGYLLGAGTVHSSNIRCITKEDWETRILLCIGAVQGPILLPEEQCETRNFFR